MQDCQVMGYQLGHYEAWNGDSETVQFTGFKPSFEGWPDTSTCIWINYVDGTVVAYGTDGEEIKKWSWAEFVKMVE